MNYDDLVYRRFLTLRTRNARPYIVVFTNDKKFILSAVFQNCTYFKAFNTNKIWHYL
jgi:hypothetical protein